MMVAEDVTITAEVQAQVLQAEVQLQEETAILRLEKKVDSEAREALRPEKADLKANVPVRQEEKADLRQIDLQEQIHHDVKALPKGLRDVRKVLAMRPSLSVREKAKIFS